MTSRQAAPRIREAGDSALLLQLEAVIDPAVNARAIAIARVVREAAMRGVRDVVSTYRSVAVYFDPLVVKADAVRAALMRAQEVAEAAPAPEPSHAVVEIPVVYGGDSGPDLDEVAAFAGLTPLQVIDRHAAAIYRVFVLGFLPGFPYMGTVAPEIAMPRRPTPRVRVPRGSVGIAGAQTGVYPVQSPGGWQIIGRTPMTLFDSQRTPPARLAPGDRVRFVPSHVGKDSHFGPPEGGPHEARRGGPSGPPAPGRRVTVLRPGLFTTIQDTGRWGHQGEGVPVGGAMDLTAHRIANALVENAPEAATLEATLIGPELRLEQDTTVAVSGADLSATVDGTSIRLHHAVFCRRGSVVRFGSRRSGARAYIAFDGGIDAPPVLGSRATHVRSGLGGLDGRALAANDQLPLGPPRVASPVRIESMLSGLSRRSLLAKADGVRVRVLPGPQDDCFPPQAMERLQRTRFVVASQSDRMGYRLQGGLLPRLDGREMISDATFAGAIQVTSSGEPILLMADRQTIGGYPQLAIVITADLPRAGQLGPGDWIEFELCTVADALEALADQEGALRVLR